MYHVVGRAVPDQMRGKRAVSTLGAAEGSTR